MPMIENSHCYGSVLTLNQYKNDVEKCANHINATACAFQDFPSDQLNELKLHYWHIYCILLQHLNDNKSQKIDGLLKDIYSLKETTENLLSAIDNVDDLEWCAFESKLVFSIIYISYLTKVAIPKGLWHTMHKTYLRAYHLAFDDACSYSLLSEIEATYKQAIIMSMFDPYKLQTNEFMFIFEKLEIFSKLVDIDNSPHFSENSIAFDRHIDEPFFRYDDYNKISESKNIFSIDLTRIKSYFNKFKLFSFSKFNLSRSANKNKVNLKHIQDIFNKATTTFIRSDSRSFENQCCFVDKPWRFANQSLQIHKQNERLNLMYKAKTVNVSESGLCLELENRFAAQFSPGETIQVSVVNPMQCYLGVIKWMTSLPHHKTKIGIEKLSVDPLPCLIDNSLVSLEEKPIGFLCYNYKSYDHGIYLVVDKSFSTSPKINVWTATDRATKHEFTLGSTVETFHNLTVWKMAITNKKHDF